MHFSYTSYVVLAWCALLASSARSPRHPEAARLPNVCHSYSPHVRFNRSEYDPGRPPPSQPPGQRQPIVVAMDRRVTDVTEVDDKERTVTVQLITYKYWNDPRILVRKSRGGAENCLRLTPTFDWPFLPSSRPDAQR